MPYVELEGHRVFYELQGQGECVLLMLPGSLGSTRLEFSSQFDYFDLNKFTLVSWDAPGFGKSRPPDRDYVDCYRRDARLLVQLMTTQLGVPQFNLLGFSDGGRTAITIASQYGGLVQKLILVGTTTFNSPKERKILELCRDVDGWSNDRRALYAPLYGDQLQSVWSEWIDQNNRLNDFATDQLASIDNPTLLLYGENDIIAPVEPHARHLKRNIRQARIHIFNGSPHNCHQERSKEFNKIVERFLLN